MKWGFIPAQELESERSKSFAVFFDWETRPSRVSLASLGLENIPQVPVNRAEVGQNHDAPKAVSATHLVLKWSGAIFLSTSSKVRVQKVLLCAFHCKPKPAVASLESPGLENFPQLSGNRAEVGQNHDLRKLVSATLSVLKWSGAIFRARNPKVSVQKVLLCSFHCKPRPAGVSLASPRQENMPQRPGNWAELGQNHDAPKVVSATLSVLKWSGAIFRARSLKVSVQKVLLCPFHWKPRPSGVSSDSPGLKNIAQVLGNRTEVDQNHDARNAVSATVLVLKWSGAIFRLRSPKVSVQKVLLCSLTEKQGHHELV